jgi:hypothetical protein
VSNTEYVSPDGRLRLLVVTSDDGDVSIGFDGFPWHTHADLLANATALAATAAVRRLLEDLFGDRSVVAVWSVGAVVRDVWVSDDPARDASYPAAGESIELRYWSGSRWFPE